jgi:transcription initiation factor TFIIE subunit alpha
MQSEHLKLLKELVSHVSGKTTEVIIDILKEEVPVNEFKIADKLKLTINQARNILYKLYNQNIVSFARKKDEKKGWYIYSWSLNVPKSLERLKAMKEKELNNFEHQLNSRENKRFYVCPNECVEFNEESAMLHQFTCPECGSVMQLASTEELAADLKNKIEKAKKEIDDILAELKKIDDVRLIRIEKERLSKRKKKLKVARKARKKKATEKKKADTRAKNKKIKAKNLRAQKKAKKKSKR